MEERFEVWVWLFESSLPIKHNNCLGAYQKGDFYCVLESGTWEVYKYPISHIWRVKESYPKEVRRD